MLPVRRAVGIAASFIALLGVSGCGTLAQSSPTVYPSSTLTTPEITPRLQPTVPGSGAIIDQAGPAPIVLANTSPDQLAAQVHLTIGGYDPTTRNLAELSVVFLHQGRWVQFVRGERLSCNGTMLSGPGTAFDWKVSADAIGGKRIACTYTSGAKSATLVFTAPPIPTLLSPADGSQINRSHATLVRFLVGGQSTMFYITALSPASKSWVYPFGEPPTNGAGTTEATIDTSGLSAGSGSIALVQSFTLPDARGAGFQSVDVSGDGEHVISVTWS